MSDRPPFVSYAQNGEDVVLARAFNPDEQPGFWIDVGAADPIVDSVTAAFSERGWTGVNIEPGIQSYQRLSELRPNEINLHCAAGARPGFAKLYPGPDGNFGLSTLVAELAERHYEGQADVPAPIEVEVRTLAEIIEQYAPPVVDFLKIDVEGFEREVLTGADWDRCMPRALVVEATAPESTGATFASWEPILVERGYELALFDGLNRFYVAPGEEELAQAMSMPANVLDHFVEHRRQSELDAAWTEFSRAEEYAFSLEAELRTIAREARLLADRVSYSEELAADALDDLGAAQLRAAAALAEASRLDRHLAAVEATRTFRYTKKARAIYSVLRRLGGAGR